MLRLIGHCPSPQLAQTLSGFDSGAWRATYGSVRYSTSPNSPSYLEIVYMQNWLM
uniref:Uncharacterized protein n=1 Tax=Anguilla anguilla TaxID=7936 RepID=A0A0E9RG59_ANGAN